MYLYDLDADGDIDLLLQIRGLGFGFEMMTTIKDTRARLHNSLFAVDDDDQDHGAYLGQQLGRPSNLGMRDGGLCITTVFVPRRIWIPKRWLRTPAVGNLLQTLVFRAVLVLARAPIAITEMTRPLRTGTTRTSVPLEDSRLGSNPISPSDHSQFQLAQQHVLLSQALQKRPTRKGSAASFDPYRHRRRCLSVQFSSVFQ